MGFLYVIAAEAATGKTALCAGLAINFINDGKKVGYLKPQTFEKDGPDSDTIFMNRLLGLKDTVYNSNVIRDTDYILVEAAVGTTPDDAWTSHIYNEIKERNARVIAVENYSGRPSRFIEVYKGFGEALLGVVLNKAPESRLPDIRGKAGSELEAAGIKLLGVISENRTLLAITVGELAEAIQGTVLTSPEKSDELVENYMLGAMVVDSGVEYFNRKARKAAVIRHERPDMQLAALETSTTCLVLSGGHQSLSHNVVEKARVKGIPLISTELSSGTIVDKIEQSLNKSRINQEKKTKRLAELVKQNLDLKSVIWS